MSVTAPTRVKRLARMDLSVTDKDGATIYKDILEVPPDRQLNGFKFPVSMGVFGGDLTIEVKFRYE